MRELILEVGQETANSWKWAVPATVIAVCL